jgi:lipoate-protein ligase A
LHDKELTYSLVMPQSHPMAKRRLLLYRTVHATLVELLADREIQASILEDKQESKPQSQPFLCFQRRSVGDVVIGDAKIAGSAQRRSAGAILQHGSVLLTRSPCAPELAGLADSAGPAIPESELIEAWLARLTQRLSFAGIRESLTDIEQSKVEALAHSKYGTDRWTKQR